LNRKITNLDRALVNFEHTRRILGGIDNSTANVAIVELLKAILEELRRAKIRTP
jgi:hypothetical protein